MSGHSKKVVGYYSSWAKYRLGAGKCEVHNINPLKYTHLVYAFAGLDEAGHIKSMDPYNDIDTGSYSAFTSLKRVNHNLKTLLAIGGWNEGSAKYSNMAATLSGRTQFADSVVSFLMQFGFDGLDVDWEYPTQRGGNPQDKENFVLLLQTLHTYLSRNGMLLTVAVGASSDLLNMAYNVEEIARYCDFINLMTYDYSSSWDGVTGHHAALNPNIQQTVNDWIDRGAPSEKLVLGIPFYARTFTLASHNRGVGAPATGPGDAGPISKECGLLAYYELQMNPNWKVLRDGGNVYAYQGNQWASYDNETTIADKMSYIKRKNLGGAMVWSLDQDYCSSLLNAINKGLCHH